MEKAQKLLNRKREISSIDKFPQNSSESSDESFPKIEKNLEKLNEENNDEKNNEKIPKIIPEKLNTKNIKKENSIESYSKVYYTYEENNKNKEEEIIDLINDKNRNKVIKLENNIIQFLGNSKETPLNELKHYVFVDNILHNIILNEPNELPDIIKWKVKLHNTSKWIAFGLCDKGKLLKHKYYWFNSKKLDWHHATFLLTNTKYTFNSVNLDENFKIKHDDFPDMNEGAEIEIEYIPFDSELNFYYKGKCIKLTKVTSNVSMKEYGLDGKIGIKDLYILTPCVVFLNDKDKIELIYDYEDDD